MRLFKTKTKADYKGSAKKYRELYYNAQETIGHLSHRLRCANADGDSQTKTIGKQQMEINEWKAKYAELLTENVRLLERIKALMEAKV